MPSHDHTPVIPTAFSSGYVSVDVEQSPNFNAGYEAAISGDTAPEVMVRFDPMPDFDYDPDCDPWDGPEPFFFGLDPESRSCSRSGWTPSRLFRSRIGCSSWPARCWTTETMPDR
jgi:hypothetical protein